MLLVVNSEGFFASNLGHLPWSSQESISCRPCLSHFLVDFYSQSLGASKSAAGLLGGMLGGVAQAYTTMGFCTFMKTVEVTRTKSGGNVSTWKIASDVFNKEGIRGLNKGVNAVALRQMTNWGSRFGIARLTEEMLKGKDQDRKLTTGERILCEPPHALLYVQIPTFSFLFFFFFWQPLSSVEPSRAGISLLRLSGWKCRAG